MISQERLKEILHYDPLTGIFTWLNCRGGVRNGERAGWLHGRGYRYITIGDNCYKEHRLAHLYINGHVPDVVDHDDGVKDNNIWTNLNPSTTTLNNRNAAKHCKNKSGITGVHWRERDQLWVMQIGRGSGQPRGRGKFDNLLDACAARKSAELALGYHPNHGIR